MDLNTSRTSSSPFICLHLWILTAFTVLQCFPADSRFSREIRALCPCGLPAAWFDRSCWFRRRRRMTWVFVRRLIGLSFCRPCRLLWWLVCQIFLFQVVCEFFLALSLFLHKRISPLEARMLYKLQPWISTMNCRLKYIRVSRKKIFVATFAHVKVATFRLRFLCAELLFWFGFWRCLSVATLGWAKCDLLCWRHCRLWRSGLRNQAVRPCDLDACLSSFMCHARKAAPPHFLDEGGELRIAWRQCSLAKFRRSRYSFSLKKLSVYGFFTWDRLAMYLFCPSAWEKLTPIMLQ